VSRNAARIAYSLPTPISRRSQSGRDEIVALLRGADEHRAVESIETALRAPRRAGVVPQREKTGAEPKVNRGTKRPARPVEPFSWHSFGGNAKTLEVHGRGLPTLYRVLRRRGATSRRFIEGIREALVLLREECAHAEERAAVWAEVEAVLRPIFEAEGIPRIPA